MTAQQNINKALAMPLYARNAQGKSLDDLGADLKARIQKLDEMIEERQNCLANLAAEEKADMEKRSKEISTISADIEQIKTDLVNQAKTRGKEEGDTIAAMLIRNTEAVEIAQSILAKRSKSSVQFEGVKSRNIVSITSIQSGGGNAGYTQNVPHGAAAQLNVIDLISWGTIATDVVTLVRETAYTIMADIAPEGTLKKESTLTFGLQVLNIGVIAHWIQVTNQVLSDMPMLAQFIQTRLAYGVRFKLEWFVINGHTPAGGQPKHWSGLMEDGNSEVITAELADTDIDVLNKAKYKAIASYVYPECYILNPEDWGNIERIKGDDGHYVYGVPNGAGVQAFLWGLPVRFSAAQNLGKFWCGNLSIGFDGYIREDVDVRVSSEDDTNFRKNMVTVLAEMRAAGGVVIPDANVTGDLPSKSP